VPFKSQAISGVKWTSISSFVNNGTQLITIIILSRLLSPSDFGVMAIINVVIEFSGYFVDMGINNALIYKQDITRNQLSSIYWLNIIMGFFLFAVIATVSPYIAGFYRQPSLVPLLIISSTIFVFIALGQQHKTLLQKELKFNKLAKIEIASRIISFAIAVYGALHNWKVYSLVFMVLSNSVVASVLFLMVGLKENKPKFYLNMKEIRLFLNFGLFQMGERLVNYIVSQFDTLVIGRALGTFNLGYYTVAKNLTNRPSQIINPVITKVAFPIMAKVQDDNEQLKKIYINTVSYLASLNFPIYLGMGLLAEPIVLVVFGKNWIPAIVILRILSMYNLIASVYSPIGSLLLAKGRVKLGFLWTMGFALIAPGLIYIATRWGTMGVAYAYLIIHTMIAIPFYLILIKQLIIVRFWEYHMAIIVPFLISFSACLVAYLPTLYISNNIAKLIVFSIILLPIYYWENHKFNKNFIIMGKSFFRKPVI
jgi:O-antigen/teichoic acid export membrane protein